MRGVYNSVLFHQMTLHILPVFPIPPGNSKMMQPLGVFTDTKIGHASQRLLLTISGGHERLPEIAAFPAAKR